MTHSEISPRRRLGVGRLGLAASCWAIEPSQANWASSMEGRKQQPHFGSFKGPSRELERGERGAQPVF